MFGELHFNQGSDQSSSSSSSPSLENDSFASMSFTYTGCHRKSDSFSSMNSESLQLCTEGLGFESFGDVEDFKNEMTEEWQNLQEKVSVITKHSPAEFIRTRSRTSGGEFPPPISCIGKSGKPWVCFKSYRHDGRFVLTEIRMPTKEVLHACREDGRLKLQFVQPNDDDDIQELEEEESDSDEEENGEEEREADTTNYEAENDLQ